MQAEQPTPRDGPNPRARTVTSILMMMLFYMVLMDILARRRARLRRLAA
jgi:hypothetical protein